MQSNDPRPSLGGIAALRRRAVTVDRSALVREGELAPGQSLPLVVEPAVERLELASWAADNRERVLDWVDRHGGVLLRGFTVRSEEGFEAFMRAVGGDLLDYTYRSTPRRQVQGKVYTSTEYPADQSIPMHNEMSYTSSWPLKIWFYCVQPAESGGETPIADSHRVYESIDPRVRERFADLGVLYVRNYGEGLDLSWQDVFQAEDPAAVEAACRSRGIEWEWREGGRLRTRQRCQGVARHPRSGDPLWFNQAHLFHVSSVPEPLRQAMLDSYGEEGLPRNAYYGDGSPIEESALAEVRRAYHQASVTFPWQQGDVLMLDNMRVAHGRRPFTGARRVVVGMAEPFGAEAA